MDGYQLGTYLENYLDSVSTLPNELKRNFTLIKELDTRTKETIQHIESLSKKNLLNAKQQQKIRGEISDSFATCVEFADEKIDLAMQTYEMVDKHIRRLDIDLRKFEQELEKKKAIDNGTETKVDRKSSVAQKVPKLNESSRAIKKPKKGKARAIKGITKHQRNASNGDEARVLNVDIDMPVDPNEPTYCFCNRVSFGEMVGCDNPDCLVEWFHFECVGLTASPKGKWLCPECTKQKKRKEN